MISIEKLERIWKLLLLFSLRCITLLSLQNLYAYYRRTLMLCSVRKNAISFFKIKIVFTLYISRKPNKPWLVLSFFGKSGFSCKFSQCRKSILIGFLRCKNCRPDVDHVRVTNMENCAARIFPQFCKGSLTRDFRSQFFFSPVSMTPPINFLAVSTTPANREPCQYQLAFT